MEKLSYYRWASYDKLESFLSRGWAVASTRITHHSHYAILLVWQGQGEPS